MNSKKLFTKMILIFFPLIPYSSLLKLFSNESYYYDEKYFRLLTNNYLEIEQGEFWNNISDGIGFNAGKDYGSIILLKDWAMYNFKLIQIIFKNNCSFEYEDFNCSAEMWLYHTKDNQYYPPGRRIYIKHNIFIIVIPFMLGDDENPGNDLIFDFFNLEGYKEKITNPYITVKKPIKLHHIIQNQPSYLFEGEYDNRSALFMVFTQYHFISNKMFNTLNDAIFENSDIQITSFGKIYRNVRRLEEIKPKATLLAYSKGSYLKNIFAFILLIFLYL